MTNTIYIKSSQTGDSAPSAGSGLKIGEVAINTNDGFMFMGQKTAGSVGDNSTAVKTIVNCAPKVRSMPSVGAMKTAATA